MCSHYEAPSSKQLLDAFGVAPDVPTQTDLWPGYMGPMIRRPIEADPDDEAAPEIEALSGMFGLLPFWAKDTKLSRSTYNARSETVATKPSFRAAWKEARHCIIPAVAIYEPDWRSGKAVPTRVTRTDGSLICIAGLWERWKSPDGETVHSMTMLTVNADEHPFMRNYHRPDDEKRMVVILPNGAIRDWLKASVSQSMEFMRQYPADRLCAEPRLAR
ncbi:SOS response-associated peptidase [uncultured Pseudomonas sp.]|uniref:SOS response-associated peptidase n=1 Tax=uncultured Pseudomonas sp. TaxID=114707 RepID=UPI0025CC3E6F|nr:SOS response-associated peptidase [uncultured Pseudomonas sp.]